jgi:hypothetical protein
VQSSPVGLYRLEAGSRQLCYIVTGFLGLYNTGALPFNFCPRSAEQIRQLLHVLMVMPLSQIRTD